MSRLNREPLISVLMPVFNGKAFLREAIESVLGQSERDFEFLIIDDGSTDGSDKIIDEAAAKDDRIRVVRRENRGLIASLNEGLELARGRYIARMDADDISLPNRFKVQVALMTTDSVDLCGCHYLIVDRSGKIISCSIQPTSPEMFPLWLCCGTPFAHGSVMMRNDFLRRHELRYGAEGFAADEDYALWTTCYNIGATFANVDDVLFKYRVHEASFSRTKIDRMTAQHHQIAQNFIRMQRCALQKAFIRALDDPCLSYQERQFLVKASVEAIAQQPLGLLFRVIRHVGLRIALPHILAQGWLIIRAMNASRCIASAEIHGDVKV